MIVRLLGTAAGGGLPQWNCGCPNCRASRAPNSEVASRTQASAALSGDGLQWFLLNASPDVRAQMHAFPALHPRSLRDTPLGGVVLANGDIDACLGLFILREDSSLHVYATESVERGLRDHNALTRTLERRANHTAWTRLELDVEQPLMGAAGPSGLTLRALPVPGTVPLHLKQVVTPSAGDNVALVFRDARGRSLVYAPTVAAHSAELERAARNADVLVFDGTFFRDDELSALGLGTRSARDMAHWPLGGPEGSLAFLATLSRPRKILTHVNNTNPILRPGAPERAALAGAGVELGEDGLELTL